MRFATWMHGDGDAVKEQGGTGDWGESNRASRQHQLGEEEDTYTYIVSSDLNLIELLASIN